jgi:lysozyme
VHLRGWRRLVKKMTISCLADQLRRDEGWRTYPYKDTVGKQTIGYGRNLDDVGISPAEGDFLLANDIKAATVALESHFPWVMGLDSVRQGVLLNMVFNIGIGGLAGFKETLAKVEAGDYAGAAQMLSSKWAQQVGHRAVRLALQMQSGEWQ